MSYPVLRRAVPFVILMLAGCGGPTREKTDDDENSPPADDDAEPEEETESADPGPDENGRYDYSLNVNPEALVAEVGETFDIDISARFYGDFPIDRFTVAYTVEEPADVVIWAGAFAVSSPTVPIAGEQSDPNSNTASFWMSALSEETVSATITGQCEREGDTTMEIVSTRRHGSHEEVREDLIGVTCTAEVDEGPSVARVRYEDHQPSCADFGMEVDCGAGTRLSAVELACLEPTLRPGGDPSIATDIECVGGLEWWGEFDAGLTHDRRNFAIFIDGDRNAATGAGGTATFGNDLSVHLSQQTGEDGTLVTLNSWSGMESTEIEPEDGWQCLESDAGDTCDATSAILGGRINPYDGFPVTLGLRFDLQIDGFEGELVYSDLPQRMGSFSADEESEFEELATWVLEGAPQLQGVEYSLRRVLD